jgi:hypothetical protein
MLSLPSVLRRSKNFTSNVAIRMPPSVPIDHYLGVPKTNKIEPRSCSIIPCTQYPGEFSACFEHSNLFKVNVPARLDTRRRAPRRDSWSGRGRGASRAAARERRPRERVVAARGAPQTRRSRATRPTGRTSRGRASLRRGRRTDSARHRFNYELFNRNNFNIRYWSWSYRGCWHQTCPPMDPG